MSEAHVDVTVRVAAEDGDRVIKVLRRAAFRDVRVLNARRTRTHETWTITAMHDETAANAGRERLRIGDVEASLAALGISFEWGTHGTGVGSISSEWLNVFFVSTQKPTGFKISVATKFEVEQELTRVADLLRSQPVELAVFPQPAWLHD